VYFYINNFEKDKKVNRKDFLRSVALGGAVLTLPLGKLKSMPKLDEGCVLIPSETAGPFPLDLTENTFFFRRNITEDREGTAFKVRMRIQDVDTCEPMENVRVNIWHCDKDGNYSGYNSESGKTYLRGYQITDINGDVEFDTIFPGWYPGRICHIHFQVFVNSAYSAVSQFTFDLEARDNIYLENPTSYTKGKDPLTFNQDGIFADGYQYQLATIEKDNNGNYSSDITVNVKGATTRVGYSEMVNAKQFVISNNYPNPAKEFTIIPIEFKKSGRLIIDLYNLDGKKINNIVNENVISGYKEIKIDLSKLNISNSNLTYQLRFENSDGVFTDCKIISLKR